MVVYMRAYFCVSQVIVDNNARPDANVLIFLRHSGKQVFLQEFRIPAQSNENRMRRDEDKKKNELH